MVPFFEFIMRWLQNLKKFGTIKIDNKYVWKWLVKLSFKSTFSLKVYSTIVFKCWELEGLKCESKWKTAEEWGVGARSLAHNTWGVEGRVGAPRWD